MADNDTTFGDFPACYLIPTHTTDLFLQYPGYNFWQWKNSQDADSLKRRVHFCASGPVGGVPVLLIHGYGKHS